MIGSRLIDWLTYFLTPYTTVLLERQIVPWLTDTWLYRLWEPLSLSDFITSVFCFIWLCNEVFYGAKFSCSLKWVIMSKWQQAEILPITYVYFVLLVLRQFCVTVMCQLVWCHYCGDKKCTVHVTTVGIQTGLCYVDKYIALLNGSVVFHLHHMVITQQQFGRCYPLVSLQEPRIQGVYMWGLASPQYLCSVSSKMEFNVAIKYWGAHGGTVVETLRYKPEGCGIDSRWCHWNFSVV
jgi:hypothetical protein